MARPDAFRYGVLAAVVLVGTGLALVGPVILRTLIDRAAEGRASTESVAALGALFLGVALAGQAIALITSYLAAVASWTTANRLRLQLTRHVLDLDEGFHRSHSPGELIERIDGDASSVSEFLSVVAVRVVAAIALVLGVVVVVFTIAWWIGAAMVAYVIGAAYVVYRERERAVTESADERRAAAELYGGIEERLTAAEDLRAAGAQTYAVGRFAAETGRYIDVTVRRERAFLSLWRNLNMAIVSGTVVALVIGAFAVRAELMSLGSAFLVYQYTARIRQPLEDLSHDLNVVQKANGAMRRVRMLLATTTALADNGTVDPPVGALSIELDRVSFHYGDDREPVLHDVTMGIGAGRSVGLVGATGSGKTTTSRLVARLVDASAGEVRLGGVPVMDIPESTLRRRVALVPQNVELIAGSVRDNLTLFDNHDEAAVDDALARVGLDRFRGAAMTTQLGPGGSGLSAGEGQLLALARAWLREPDLVVLDEPTSRVDPATEARLEQAVAELLTGRTALVIAHRLGTLDAMDDIVVLDGGRVVESGPRAELVADPQSRFAGLLRRAAAEPTSSALGVATSGSGVT